MGMSDVGVPPALAVRSGLESLEVNLLAMQELWSDVLPLEILQSNWN